MIYAKPITKAIIEIIQAVPELIIFINAKKPAKTPTNRKEQNAIAVNLIIKTSIYFIIAISIPINIMNPNIFNICFMI